MAVQGITLIDFGPFPGGSDASVAVADAAIAADSFVAAWLYPQATTDHTADEHLVESLRIVAGGVQAGVGFTIWGIATQSLAEPVPDWRQGWNQGGRSDPAGVDRGGGRMPRIWGTWTVMYSWV